MVQIATNIKPDTLFLVIYFNDTLQKLNCDYLNIKRVMNENSRLTYFLIKAQLKMANTEGLVYDIQQ